MDSSFCLDTLAWVGPLYFQGVTVYNFQVKLSFFSLKIVFVLTNSVDPDEMALKVAFHLGLHLLPKYSNKSHQYAKSYRS